MRVVAGVIHLTVWLLGLHDCFGEECRGVWNSDRKQLNIVNRVQWDVLIASRKTAVPREMWGNQKLYYDFASGLFV